MSITHRAFFPLCVLALSAALVMPRLGEVADKTYTNSIGMEFVLIPAGTPVGQKEPNGWGLYDVHGNVWEWVQDWYDERYYANCLSMDPPGPQ